jgi:hypothetical protein
MILMILIKTRILKYNPSLVIRKLSIIVYYTIRKPIQHLYKYNHLQIIA